jgi:hypothetical protein
MRDKDAQLMMEALRPNDRRDAYRGSGVDPETGEKQSGDEHAKHVQWTKDTKAKLAQAQATGDSKLANKLQRYLDMHGIDEAGGSSNTAEVLAQLKVDIDEFFSSGDANDFGAEGIKEAILDMIDQAERFGVPSEPAHEPVPDHSDLIQPTNY